MSQKLFKTTELTSTQTLNEKEKNLC